MGACDRCLRRTWLLERLGGHLDFRAERIELVLAAPTETLLAGWLEVETRRRRRRPKEGSVPRPADLPAGYERFDRTRARAQRRAAAAAGLDLVCRCDPAYPERLRRLDAPPAVLHVAGGLRRFLDLAAADPVAIVGTRRPTLYGSDVAGRLGRDLSLSGLTVISGLATGVDAAAHRGALTGGGRALAVLPGCAAEPYPRANRQLHRRLVDTGAVVSELGPGASVRRWTLVARNRLIAALSELTVVVQAGTRSGSLRTAEFAQAAGGRVGAVPGSVLIPQSEGPHELLRRGACLIHNAQDILDAVCGVGVRPAAPRPAAVGLGRPQREVLDAIRAGADTVAALAAQGVGGGGLLALLGELELAGCLRRQPGGRYVTDG
ncbi:MAG TPA: DNA-processing protein DprA [Solirubrobacteraceae bacterium]|nr:DNA-processing protein DprA [Solirubrobacteraceae bacterium]